MVSLGGVFYKLCTIIRNPPGHFAGVSIHGEAIIHYDGNKLPKATPLSFDDSIDFIYEIWYAKILDDIKLYYPIPLRNGKNVCYMNSVIQIIFGLVPLRRSLLDFDLPKPLRLIDDGVTKAIFQDNTTGYIPFDYEEKLFLKPRHYSKFLKQVRSLLNNMEKKRMVVLKQRDLSVFEAVKSLDFNVDFPHDCSSVWETIFNNLFSYVGCTRLTQVFINTIREPEDPNLQETLRRIVTSRHPFLLLRGDAVKRYVPTR
jgi:hypothetical protein